VLANDISRGVIGVEETRIHDPTNNTRATKPISPNIQGRGEETLDRRLISQPNLERNALNGGTLILGSHRANPSIGLVLSIMGPITTRTCKELKSWSKMDLSSYFDA
jgi:hypothetical protein